MACMRRMQQGQPRRRMVTILRHPRAAGVIPPGVALLHLTAAIEAYARRFKRVEVLKVPPPVVLRLPARPVRVPAIEIPPDERREAIYAAMRERQKKARERARATLERRKQQA